MATAAALAVFAGDGAIWADIRMHRDDTYRQLLAWAPRGIPVGSTVAATDDVTQFVLADVRLGQWAGLAALRANSVDFVVVSSALADRGYGLARPDFVAELNAAAQVVFTAHGRTMGDLRVYDVRDLVDVEAHSR